MSTSPRVDNETMANANSCFAKVTKNDILQMQNITIPKNTKKATKLGMKVFRDKQCFNTQFAHMSHIFCPDCQAPLMLLFLNNNCPSMAPFQSPNQVSSTSIEQNVFIHENLKMIVISNTLTTSTSTFLKETSQTVLSISISSKLKLP